MLICRTTAKEKKPSQSRHIFTRLWNGGFDFQSRRFFAFAQTYDEFSGNIVVNSDLNCCICLKIKKYLMSLPHLPTSANFHQDIILHIQEVHQWRVRLMHSLILVWFLSSFRKELKNHTRIRLCIKRTRHWWTSWICKIISWWKFADVGRCGRLIRYFLIFKQIQQFKSLLTTIFPENSS